MNLAVNLANRALIMTLGPYDNATLTMYAGTQPTTPETALIGGNTVIVTYTFSAPAFGSPAFSAGQNVVSANFVSSSVLPTNNGVITFARVTLNSTAWGVNQTYVRNQIVSANGNLYCCIVGGASSGTGTGPSTTNLGITDGNAVWDYYGPNSGQNNVLGDFTIGTSGADIIIGNTTASTTVPVAITSFKLQVPAA